LPSTFGRFGGSRDQVTGPCPRRCPCIDGYSVWWPRLLCGTSQTCWLRSVAGGRGCLRASSLPPQCLTVVHLELLLRWSVTVNRLLPVVSRIIPGDWGKAGPGWLVWPLLSCVERRGGGGRIHQFLWQRSRAASTREKGTEQRGVIRNHSELSQVARPSFGAG
jgi:hypothetical protein